MTLYPIGTQFTPLGKHSTLNTITDVHVTRNLAGEVVKICYVAKHDFMGQTVTNSDIASATIARGNPSHQPTSSQVAS